MLVPVWFALETLAVGETCPAAVDVETRVRTILHLKPDQVLSESFLVERHEAGLYVVLRGSDSVVIGERTLPLEGSCDELAQAAAVVLSAWLTDVHPDFAGALPPRAEPVPEPEPQPKAQPTRSLEVSARPQPATRPEPPSPARVDRFEAGLALGVDLTNEVFAVAGLLSAGYGAQDRGFGVVALLAVTASREQPLEPGRIRWWRWPLAVGPTFRLGAPGMSADLSAGPLASWLHLEGSAFDRNSAQNAVTWGGFATLRVSGWRRPLAPFGLINVQLYPADAKAYVTNLAPEWPIPRWSLVGAVGARLSY